MSTPGDAPRRTVLVASDGSPAAATAIPLAHAVAAQLAATVEVLRVVAGDEAGAGSAPPPTGEGLRVRTDGRDPAPSIVRAAAEPDVAVLVMATHGRAVEPGRELGRVAKAVIARTTRPVLLVHPEVQVIREDTGLRHLLVPVDLTPKTGAALVPVAELACRLGAAVDLLHVAPHEAEPEPEPGSLAPPRYVDQPHHEWPPWAQEVMDSLAPCVGRLQEHVPVHLYHAHGDIGAAVVRFAAEHHEDAVVLVRRSRMETGRARVLREVLQHTPCPVLLVGA